MSEQDATGSPPSTLPDRADALDPDDTALTGPSPQHAWIDACLILGNDHLVVSGWAGKSVDVAHVSRESDDDRTRLAAHGITVERRDLPSTSEAYGFALLLPLNERDLDQCGPIVVGQHPATIAISPRDIREACLDDDAFVAHARAALRPADRTRLASLCTFALLGTASQQSGSVGGGRLARLRDALRERLASRVPSADDDVQVRIDALVSADPTTFFVIGWIWTRVSPITSLLAISPEGAAVEIASSLYRFRKPDTDRFFGSDTYSTGARTGFAATFTLPVPSAIPTGWVLQLRTADDAIETVAPAARHDPLAARDVILQTLEHQPPWDHTLVREHVHPAIQRLAPRGWRQGGLERELHLGEAPTAPAVSLIVPLYRQLDLVQHQLAQMADDPEIVDADVLYILDSPWDASWFVRDAAGLHETYGVPFRLLIPDRNLGYAGANNLGASRARGRLLLFLNSDVIPRTAGWVGTMQRFYEQTPRIGALGPKLLYEDDTIQHAGMWFRWLEEEQGWRNEHRFKGLYRELEAAAVAARIPALTGACLMLERSLFEQVGGFDQSFVQGDFEDSDLCLRLIERGRDCWYLPTAELYHLEGQSFPPGTRTLTSRYNTWLHTSRWDAQIRALMRRYDPVTAALSGLSA